MKTLIVSAMLVMLGLNGNVIHAQESDADMPPPREQRENLSPEERIKRETEKATAKLGLSADQQEKWKNASTERVHANEPLKQKMQGSTTPQERKTLRDQIHANNKAFDAKVQTFLTVEQKSKFEALKKEHLGKRHARHGHQGMKE